MCAYNAIDGIPACANQDLLQKTLRQQWAFSGFVTSDCGAVSDFFSPAGHHFSADQAHAAAAAVLAGTDTSCGSEYAALTEAVKSGLLPESAIDEAVKRLYTARFRLGLFDSPNEVPYAQIPFSENDSPAHRALALEAARKAMVLLKNEGQTLPLSGSVQTLAVIGPNAASLAALEGNYNAVPSHPVVPLDGIIQEFRKHAKVIYAQGAPYDDRLPLPVPRTALRAAPESSQAGLKAEYFASSDLSKKPAMTRIDKQIEFDWNSASPVTGVPANDFGVRWSGVITPPQAGEYIFSITFAHCYPCSDRESYAVYLDGKQVTSQTTDESKASRPSTNPPFQIQFPDTKPHTIRIDYTHHAALFGAGITLNWQPPAGSLLPEALTAAKQADAVIAFVGLSPELEGEEMPVHVEGFAGGDRTKIDLPASQQRLLEELAATGKPLIVVLMNGSALAVDWAQQHASAILEAWYPGEGGGEAIAETLSGKNNPGGRLPVTFYASLDQLPPFTDYSMNNRTYRFFHGQPLYRFGYGLSYAHFTYSNLHLSSTSSEEPRSTTDSRPAPKSAEVPLSSGGAGSLPVLASEELAQDGRGVKRARQGAAGSSPCLGARIHGLCALNAGDTLTAEADVRNVGTVAGDEVVEIYLKSPSPASLNYALEGFQRLSLSPAETRHVTFKLDPRQLSEVAEDGTRSIRPGSYILSLGGDQPVENSGDLSATFTISGTKSLPR